MPAKRQPAKRQQWKPARQPVKVLTGSQVRWRLRGCQVAAMAKRWGQVVASQAGSQEVARQAARLWPAAI